MSQVKLTLRPPPNVDFVHGYPGIPPGGPERPQAAVKGAIEVRCLQGVKAKWLRIELRKVETLPTGGAVGTFYDFVGPSPVNLWQSSNEYDLLRTQDFPFSIRIPESIPPSVMLENRAGIQYELVASLCTKGKKNFFRKRKSVVVSTQAAIIIDKHELHSTWPVYNQPETRHASGSGCTLLVERSQTCYGPGDRIGLFATLRSDSLDNAVLRGFELTLRETTIFNLGPHAHANSGTGSSFGKKGAEAPKPKTVVICDSKLAVNAPLAVGAVHRAELATALSGSHTTTTLNAARHIDVTYVLSVRAVLDGPGVQPIILDLPVVVSNWQRNVSEVAINRIGPAPGLSLIPVQNSGSMRQPAPVAHTLPARNPIPAPAPPQPVNANTMPNTNAGGIHVDELGYGIGAGLGYTPSLPSTVVVPSTKGKGGGGGKGHKASNSVGSGKDEVRPPTAGSTVGPGKRPGSASTKLAVVNVHPDEIREVDERIQEALGGGGYEVMRRGPSATVNVGVPVQQPQPQQPQSHPQQQQQQWLSAKDEKMLYEAAKLRAEQTQNMELAPPRNGVSPSQQYHETTEDEKRRYKAARAVALERQGPQAYIASPSPIPNVNVNVDAGVSVSPAVAGGEKKFGAALYTQAITARNQALAQEHQQRQQQTQTPTNLIGGGGGGGAPKYPSAEDEKAALRYEEAKMAVNRVQNDVGPELVSGGPSMSPPGSAPIAYEHLYPGGGGGGRGSSSDAHLMSPPPPASEELPPPFEGGGPISAYEEKERLKRQYERQDAAAASSVSGSDAAVQPVLSVPDTRAAATVVNGMTSSQVHSPPPPSFTRREPVGAEEIKKALSEKEILRRKYEAEDAAAAAGRGGSPRMPQPLPRSGSVSSSTNTSSSVHSNMGPSGRGRPTPPTPAVAAPGKVLSAAEEKALLKAQYALQDATAAPVQTLVNGAGLQRTTTYSPAPAPASVSVPKRTATHSHAPGLTMNHSPSSRAPQSVTRPQPQKSASVPAPAPPPPLMPRPPAEYIRETQEEDERVTKAMGRFAPAVASDEEFEGGGYVGGGDGGGVGRVNQSFVTRTPSPLRLNGNGNGVEGGGGYMNGSMGVNGYGHGQ